MGREDGGGDPASYPIRSLSRIRAAWRGPQAIRPARPASASRAARSSLTLPPAVRCRWPTGPAACVAPPGPWPRTQSSRRSAGSSPSGKHLRAAAVLPKYPQAAARAGAARQDRQPAQGCPAQAVHGSRAPLRTHCRGRRERVGPGQDPPGQVGAGRRLVGLARHAAVQGRARRQTCPDRARAPHHAGLLGLRRACRPQGAARPGGAAAAVPSTTATPTRR